MTVLRLDNVTRRFRTVRALEGITTSVEAGEIRALIGPNGAGKTTLINIVTGFLPASGGHVYLDEHRIDRRRAHERVGLGLARTFQTPQLCPALSVRDNIVVGAHRRLAAARFRTLFSKDRVPLRRLRDEAEEVAGRVGLTEVLDLPASAVLYIGDMTVDIETARAAGVRVWVVPTGSDPRDAIERARPDRLLADLREILAELSGS